MNDKLISAYRYKNEMLSYYNKYGSSGVVFNRCYKAIRETAKQLVKDSKVLITESVTISKLVENFPPAVMSLSSVRAVQMCADEIQTWSSYKTCVKVQSGSITIGAAIFLVQNFMEDAEHYFDVIASLPTKISALEISFVGMHEQVSSGDIVDANTVLNYLSEALKMFLCLEVDVDVNTDSISEHLEVIPDHFCTLSWLQHLILNRISMHDLLSAETTSYSDKDKVMLILLIESGISILDYIKFRLQYPTYEERLQKVLKDVDSSKTISSVLYLALPEYCEYLDYSSLRNIVCSALRLGLAKKG